MKIILGSTSKLKSEILNKVCIKHTMIESNFNEDLITNNNVYEYVKELSLGKAKSIINKVDKGIIIGLDTVVYVDNKTLEKPKSIDEAKEFIKMCANNTTSVITGLTLINKETNEIINEYVETKVSLRKIDEVDIDYYIENEKDAMYVSGFVVETIVSNFIENINGSFYNILGVPVETIYKHINNMGYNLKDLEGR